jgi:ribosomal protein S7
MSRRNISKAVSSDAIYNSYLVSLLITRILKSGKKQLQRKLFMKFDIIKRKQMKIH